MSSNGKRKAKSEPEEKATFDFRRVSRQWTESWYETSEKVSRAVNIMQRPIPDDLDDDEIQMRWDAKDAALLTIKQAAAEQRALISQVLVDVPRSWLLVDISLPEMIDWRQVESLDFMHDEGFNKLLNMVNSGEARNTAKN